MTADPGSAALSPPMASRAGDPHHPTRSPSGVRSAVGSIRRWFGARSTATLTAIAVLVAAGLVLALRSPLGLSSTSGSAAATPTSAGIESQWGIRFTQIGISADGGMVDVRYVVLDVDKASAVAATAKNTPLLIEEKSKRVIYAVAMKAHAHDLQAGGRYYLLYRNTNGLLSPGRRVTITLGGDRLEHLTVLGTKAQ